MAPPSQIFNLVLSQIENNKGAMTEKARNLWATQNKRIKNFSGKGQEPKEFYKNRLVHNYCLFKPYISAYG